MAKKNLLAVDKFISEMHLKQPKFTYSSCGPFKETTKEYKIFEETGDSRQIYIKMNQVKLVFNMIKLIEILKIQQDEQLQIKF